MENKKNLNINRGAAILLLLFVLLFILLFARFLYIEIKQEVSGKSLHALAEELWEDKRIIEAQRGPIFDRKGNVLAQNIPAYKIYAIVDETHPNHVKDPKKTASLLAPILGGNEEELVRTLEQKDRFQVEFGAYGRKLTQAQKAEIESLSLPGIGFSHESTRYYPNQVFASHILGFATEDAETETQQGMLGLEKAFNDYLTEQNGSITYKRDASGIKLPVPEERITKPKNGNEIYLTLDEKIQLFVEQALNEVMEQYDPERAMAIVVDPKTGEVVAMGNAPSFNPNKRDVESYVNNPISSRFEPGSTMKIFTLAAAIEEGVYNGQEAFQSGRYQVAGGVISDHNNGQGWGSISFDEGVRRSSNVGFSILAKEKIGLNRFYQYLLKFGFDKPTDIDLPDEVSSKIQYEYEIEKVTTSFGQGTAVTPIQQVQAATAIANNGAMMRPFITKKIVDPNEDKVILENEPVVAGKPISPDTAKKVRDLLRDVVTDGTGQSFAIEEYEVAGKTGTAEIPSPEGGYMKGWGNNIYSFLGMAPYDDPKLIVYVAVDRPKLEDFEPGAAVTSQLFKTIMKNSLQHLNVEPSDDPSRNDDESSNDHNGIPLANYSGIHLDEARKELEEQGFNVTTFGNNDSLITGQLPFPETSVLSGERILLKGEGDLLMPDATGWSLADLFKLAEILQLEVNIDGSGFVVKQSIPANEVVRSQDILEVSLAPPNVPEDVNRETEEEQKNE